LERKCLKKKCIHPKGEVSYWLKINSLKFKKPLEIIPEAFKALEVGKNNNSIWINDLRGRNHRIVSHEKKGE
jgi:hypothetical protein